MTSYTAIPDADIDAESPVTETLLTLIRDNPIAITEGASGAPAVVNAALDSDVGAQSATAQATTSGSTKDFSIATGARRIVVSWRGVSPSTSAVLWIQVDGETSGYSCVVSMDDGTSATGSDAFYVTTLNTLDVDGSGILTLLDPSAHIWSFSSVLGTVGGSDNWMSAGSIDLSSEIDTLRFGISAGSFNAGSVGCQVDYVGGA